MKTSPLLLPFSLALFFAFFSTVLFPQTRLFAFAPFFAILIGRTSLLNALWIAAGCGVIIDLLNTELRFGTFALNYCLVTLLVFKQRRQFFEDKPLSIALFTTVISSLSTLLQFVLTSFSDKAVSLSWALGLTDFLLMPAIDGLYAFLWFSCPMMLYAHIKKVGWRTLYTRIKSYVPWLRAEEEN